MNKLNAIMRLFLSSVGMCAILSGAVHVSGAEGDQRDRHPLGLNENHPYGRLTSEYVTPHVAWSAVEARQRLLDEIVGNIVAFESGGERNRVG